MSLANIDVDASYLGYLERFTKLYGEKPTGAFVKFGKHMVSKLGRDDFEGRLDHYLKMHASCKKMLSAGSTVSDAVVMEFEESGAWVVVQTPNVLAMFRGELGDPEATKPLER